MFPGVSDCLKRGVILFERWDITCLLSTPTRNIELSENAAASTELPPTPDMLSSVSVHSRDQTPVYSPAVRSGFSHPRS